MRSSLSVTLLAINDEENIKKCLNSVKSFADEIIVAIDDKTTDNSFAVAKKFTDKVFIVPHLDNFHLNKVKANDKATGDWVLQMDSDEFVTPALADSIKSLLEGKSFGYDSWQSPFKKQLHLGTPQRLSEPASAYYLTRKNFFLGRYLMNTGQYPDPVIRLFKRGEAFLPAKDVHEQMVVKGVIGFLKGDLDHYATPQFSRYLIRENRYSSLLAEELKTKRVRINPLSFIDYMMVKPLSTFCSLYFRYRGFLDGFPGFVFSLFSAIHFQLAYMKLWELYTIK